MKTFIFLRFVFIITFLLQGVISKTQVVYINQTFNSDEEIFPFNQVQNIYGLNITATIQLNSDSSLVRLILVDNNYHEYLIYEGYPAISLNNNFTIINECEETCYLDSATPSSIKIEIIDASILLSTINITNTPVQNANLYSLQVKQQKNTEKINALNSYITQNNMLWKAGETSVSNLSFAEKKIILGEKFNVQGLEYYKYGIFMFLTDLNKLNKSNSTMIDFFDWRNRHGANNSSSPYYDGDPAGSGWLTSVESQIGGTCYAFSAVGITEAMVNIYFNQHIDLDLSEQDGISCSGCPTSPHCVLTYIINTGVVHEYCFPFQGDASIPCNITCYDELTKISGIFKFQHESEDKLKELIVINGPMSGTICPSNCHAMTLVGFGKIKEGDCVGLNDWNCITIPLGHYSIGQTYWIFKNSWGVNWGENGYVKILYNYNDITAYNAITPIINPLHSTVYNDIDGDGYYWWGIGTMPAGCPGDPSQEDCDDSNPFLGPYDPVTYECQLLCDNFTYNTTPIEISSDKTWFDEIINQPIEIKPGATLTIKGKIRFQENCKIIVEPGAKLVINEGILTTGCENTMWQGIEVWGDKNQSQLPHLVGGVWVWEQGIVELKNGAVIENARCGITTCQKDVYGNINWNITGGIIKAENSYFRNCWFAVDFLSYHNFHPTTHQNINNISCFKNCVFETTSQLAEYEYPFAFVSLYDVEGIKFYGCTFRNTTSTGIYSDYQRGNGIISENAGYILQSYCSQPISPCPETYTIYNTFENLCYAIDASNNNSLNTVYIKNCNFNNNFGCIILNNIKNATIIKNNFDIGIFQIGPPLTSTFGIYLNNSTGYKIEENNFSSSYQVWVRGIIVNNSGASANEIYKNTFENLSEGVQAQGINASKAFVGGPPPTGLVIKCNKFSNITGADISITSGRIAPNQNYCNSDPTTPANNQFSPVCNSLYNHIWVNSSVTPFNYSINPDNNTEPLCYTQNKVNLIYCDNTTYNPATSCPSHLISPYPTHNQIKQTIKSNTIQKDNLIAEIDGGNTQTLLNKIYQNKPSGQVKEALLAVSPYVSDTVLLSAIRHKPTPLPAGILKEILIPNSPLTDSVMQAVITRTPALPGGIMQEVNNVQVGTSERTLLEREIAYLEHQIGLAENELFRQYLNDTLINGIDSVIAYLQTKTDIESQKLLIQAYLQTDRCNDAKTLLTNIPQDNPENTNFYTFFNLMADLCTADKNVFQLTNAQEQTVRDIANSGTSTAVNAQAILTLVYGEEFPLIIEKLEFPDSLTIYGELFANPLCGGMAVAGDTIILLDTAYNIVTNVSVAVTNDTGKFVFYLPELLQLQHINPTARYTLDTKDRTAIVDTVFKTIAEWIEQSPVQLRLKKTEAEIIFNADSCYSENIYFKAKISGGLKPYTYHWDFGNGNTSIAADTLIFYSSAGDFPVTLIVSDNIGCTDTAQQIITVVPPFIASFSTATSICLGDTLYLNNNTSVTNPACNIPINYTWDLGNGDIIYTKDAAYKYDQPGTYTIKLVASDEHGFSDTASNTITVYALPVSGISNDTTINKCDVAYLSASPGYVYQWSPGKYLTDSTIYNPVAIPEKTTMFTVLITDILTGCFTRDTVMVYVQDIPVVFNGNQNNSYFGYTVFTESDFNGDGINDIVIGAMDYDSYGKVNNGSLSIFYGDTNFTDKSFADADLVLYGEASYNQFGSSLSAADVNNDGIDDLIIGARCYNTSMPGYAYIYNGSVNGISSTYNAKFSGQGANDIFGNEVKGIGDVNGDGYEDIVIGAHFYTWDNSGKIYIFHGSQNGISSKPAVNADAIITGTYTWNHLGYFIIKELGDINNDGFDDIMVSGDDGGATVKGHVYIFFGSPSGIGTQNATAADIIFESSANGTRFGDALAGGKDINNDGFPDLVINEAVTGKVYIYYGTATGWNATPDLTISNSAFYFGNRLKLMDINQDYFADILIGSNYYKNDSSAVYIVYGNSNLSGGDIENIYGEKYVTEKSFYHQSDGLDVYVNNVQEINLVIPNGIYDNYKGKVSFYNTCRIYNPSVLLKISNVQNNEISQSSFLNVYPNPNDGNMQVVYEIPENETGILEIYDIIGKKLLSYPLYGGNNTFAISGTTLDKGIYFYQATAGNKRIGTDKIVVIK